MALEIERKFLVTSDAWRDGADGGTRLRQGYLCADAGRTVRVRVAGAAARLTIKGPTEGISRSEYEYDIPKDDALEMLDHLSLTAPIAKTRYRVRHGQHVWEVDVFEGENTGLIVAEIELDNESESFERPEWLGREVSHDARYFNSSLSRQPYGTWAHR